jgi:hypothetical protein
MYIRSVMPFNRLVSNIARNLAPTPRKVKPEPKWRCKFSKEQILDMRTKYHFQGWSQKRIEEHFGMTTNEAYRYLNYIVQTYLVPKRP